MFRRVGQYEISIERDLFTFTNEDRAVSLTRLGDGFALKLWRYQVCVSHDNKTTKSDPRV